MNTNWRNVAIGLSVLGSVGGYLYDRAGGFESESWTEYEDDRYSISFPTSHTPDGIPGDQLTGMMVSWRDHTYAAGWIAEDKANQKAADESVMKGLTQLSQQTARVEHSKMNAYEGMSAFDFELVANQDGSGEFWRYLRKGDRLYMLWVKAYGGQALDPSSPEIQKFLSSFHAR
jgi:hypothetical protein